MKRLLYLTIILFLFQACSDTKKGETGDIDTENLFFDYSIWGEEGNNMVRCMFQFREGGINGTSLILKEPYNIELDGKKLDADSAKLTGAFYETSKPIDSFAGKHAIVFTDPDLKEYTENFVFQPFSLLQELPGMMEKKPFIIKLKDPGAEEIAVRLVITDTAFASKDVNDVFIVKNGELPVTQHILDQLSDGPVSLEIYKEEERHVKIGSKVRGRISITYSLKRQFIFTK